MFGVLVVQDSQERVGYLSAFSGMLNHQWEMSGFVPPLFDIHRQQAFLVPGENQLQALSKSIEETLNAPERLSAQSQLNLMEQQQRDFLDLMKRRNKLCKQERDRLRQFFNPNHGGSIILNQLTLQSQRQKKEYKHIKKTGEQKIKYARDHYHYHYERPLQHLKQQRQRLSQSLHQQVFSGYAISNARGQSTALQNLFKQNLPPGGAGDCAAPKLLQFAYHHQLKPLALAEFWWGAAPVQSIRHHLQYYSPCRSKCQVILPHMLQGLTTEEFNPSPSPKMLIPDILYEDDYMLAINKPSGLLSIPGKHQQHSVLNWLEQNYPESSGALLVHRLDMSTSGILLAAKSARAHKHLQHQFIKRQVQKKYVAILSRPLPQKEWVIDLPLRVDLEDRPRQLVCYKYGKPASTRVTVVSTDQHTSRVHLYPKTGRTHQLRIHMAHPLGLKAPIVGDELYGIEDQRLMLHAESIRFKHPVSDKTLELKSPVPF